MFDFWKIVIQAFTGNLKHDSDGRKLIWILIITAAFGLASVAFVAYVGYTRYYDMLGALPYSETVAFMFCILIAGFMFFAFSYIASFTMDLWMKGKSRHTWQGAALLTVAVIIVGIVDYNMNIDGAADVAKTAVGTIAEVNENAIKAKYQSKIDELKKEKDLILGKYWYKGKLYFEPYPVTRHPKSRYLSDKKKVDDIDTKIAEYEGLILSDIKDAKSTYSTTLSQRNDREDLVRSRLQTAVKGVYFVQFILTLIMSFIILKCMDALEASEEKVTETKPLVDKPTENIPQTQALFPGFAQGRDVVSTRDLNLIKRFEATLARMESQMKAGDNVHINRSNDQVNPGLTPGQIGQKPDVDIRSMTTGASDKDIKFLNKYKQVVKLVLCNSTTGQIISSTNVSRSTIKNVKRVMRAVNMIPESSTRKQ